MSEHFKLFQERNRETILFISDAESWTSWQDTNIIHNRSLQQSSIQQHLLSFISVGKPFFENIQYNSPIDIYDDDTVDEMVKIMNNAPPLGSAPLVNNNHVEPVIKTDDDEAGEAVSNLGWSVRTSTKTLSKNNFNNFPSTKLPWSSDM